MMNEKYYNPVNILYLTTDCNFECYYCYENQKNKKIKKYATKEDIEFFVDDIIKRTSKEALYYNVCLMGGEPFLALDKMKYFMKYIEKYPDKNFSVNVITNGSLLHNCVSELYEWTHSEKYFFGLDISYDGSFQYQRDKSDIVKNNIDLMEQNNIPFSISYTITKESFENKAYLKDIVTIIKQYFLNKRLGSRHIRVNVDSSFLYSKNMKKVKADMKNEFLYLYSKFQIPICYFSCDFCKKCDFSNTGYHYLVPESGTILEENFTINRFSHF